MIFEEPRNTVCHKVISRHCRGKQARRGKSAKPEIRNISTVFLRDSGGYSERQKKGVDYVKAHLQPLKSRELLKIRDFQQFSGFTTVENGFIRSSRFFLLFYFYFYFQKGDFIYVMIRFTPGPYINSSSNIHNLSNFMGIHEMTADGTSYDMIDTSIDEGQLIYIEVKRQ